MLENDNNVEKQGHIFQKDYNMKRQKKVSVLKTTTEMKDNYARNETLKTTTMQKRQKKVKKKKTMERRQYLDKRREPKRQQFKIDKTF